MKRYAILCFVLISITACLPWVRTGGPYTAPALRLSVDLPDGWMRLNTDEYLLITRDGVLLEYIMIEKIHVDDELKHTKKKFRRGMLSQDLAQVIIDNNSSNPDVLNLKVISSKPVKINGHRGFKLYFSYKDKESLKYKGLYYGFMEGDWFYGIRYNGTERHYFKKELNTFKNVLGSLKMTS